MSEAQNRTMDELISTVLEAVRKIAREEAEKAVARMFSGIAESVTRITEPPEERKRESLTQFLTSHSSYQEEDLARLPTHELERLTQTVMKRIFENEAIGKVARTP